MGRDNLDRMLVLVLLITTVYAYWYLQHCDFIHFDDPFYVTENYRVRTGLISANFIWALTTFHSSNWHPLTWFSHMLDYDVYGLNPAGHHLTNLLFHLGNTLLLFLFLREATHQPWRSFLVAALFSLHPLHVESVAWVSERKDVLSTFFWMLALAAYVYYARRPGISRYLYVLFSFALGLMAKPMLVTFPFVLMLMDFWPLKRLSLKQDRCKPEDAEMDVAIPSFSWSRLIWEKVPFLILTVASCIVTVMAQSEGRAIRSLEGIPFSVRIANALVSYIRYLVSMFWPNDLTVFYPHPGSSLEPRTVMLCALVLVTLSGAAMQQISRRPYLFAGWFWYLGTLIPVIGLVQVGDQGMADRYTYIPLVGVAIVVVWGLSDLFAGCKVRRVFAASLGCAVLLALMGATRSQLRYWQNTHTLCEQALQVTDNNYLAHFLLGQVEDSEGNFDKAFFHRQKAVAINPIFVARMHNRWGYNLAEEGQLDEAMSEFSKSLEIHPNYTNAHNNLGVVLARKGQFDEAIAHFVEALRISPHDLKVRESLRNAEFEKNRARTLSSSTP